MLGAPQRSYCAMKLLLEDERLEYVFIHSLGHSGRSYALLLQAAAGVGHVKIGGAILASKNANHNFCLQNQLCDTGFHVALEVRSEAVMRLLSRDGRADVS